VAKAYLLADKKKAALPVVADAQKVVVTVGAKGPDAINSVVVLTLNAK
jgi:hypothetical protein